MIFINMSLKQSIRRVLKENDYSPAGKEITPNSIVVHKSNPMFRDKIMSDGLKVKAGECYRIYVGYGTKCKPAIFATNSTNKRAWFDSTYDDDIWFIDTRMIPDVKWYKDRHFESTKKHIVTFQDIPREAITLHYEGTGSGDVKKWGKDSPNLFESIRRILKEEIDILSVRRRLYIVDDYIQNLSSKDICNYWSSDEVDNYVNETMAEIVRVVLDSTKGVNADNWHGIYEEIYEILIDLGYREKIEDFFYDSLDNCGKIIKENNSHINRKEKIQKLIDDEIESMKEICKQMDADDEEIISFDACDFLDLDPKVRVTSVDKLNGVPRIMVVIEYKAMMHFHDEETFISELRYRLHKWITNIYIDVEDVINTYPDEKRQW